MDSLLSCPVKMFGIILLEYTCGVLFQNIDLSKVYRLIFCIFLIIRSFCRYQNISCTVSHVLHHVSPSLPRPPPPPCPPCRWKRSLPLVPPRPTSSSVTLPRPWDFFWPLRPKSHYVCNFAFTPLAEALVPSDLHVWGNYVILWYIQRGQSSAV